MYNFNPFRGSDFFGKFFLFVLLELFTTQPLKAQTNSTNVNTIRELAIIIKLGFENMEKQRQADREAMEKRFEYLERLIQANKEALEKLIQANKEALERRMAFLENLMIVMITTVFTQLVYIIWTDRKSRQPLPKQHNHVAQKTIPLEEFEKLLERVQQLENQRA